MFYGMTLLGVLLLAPFVLAGPKQGAFKLDEDRAEPKIKEITKLEFEVEAQTHDYSLDDPYFWRGDGFYFVPATLNAALVACTIDKADPQCPVDTIEGMAAYLKKAKGIEPVKVKDMESFGRELATFGSKCLGKPERRFQGPYCQPDGILFVPVLKQYAWCKTFAKDFTFFANRAALSVAWPRTGLAFDLPQPEESKEAAPTEERQLADLNERYGEDSVKLRYEDFKTDGKTLADTENAAYSLTGEEKEALAEMMKKRPKEEFKGREEPPRKRSDEQDQEQDVQPIVISSSSSSSSSSSQNSQSSQNDESTNLPQDEVTTNNNNNDGFLSVAEHAKASTKLRRVHHLLSQRENSRHHRNPFLSAGGVIPLYRFLYHRVNYAFHASAGNGVIQGFRQGADAWEAKTCISFREVKWANVGSDGLKVIADLARGAWGAPKEVHMHAPTCDVRCITHEIGHSLGLAHVQQREDRDRYLDVHRGNIPTQYAQYETYTEAVTPPAHPTYMDKSDRNDVGMFDWDSIMLYGPAAFANPYPSMDPQTYTLEERTFFRHHFGWARGLPPHTGTWGFKGQLYGGGDEVTDMDAHIINLKYGCYARNRIGGDRWVPGANPQQFKICTPFTYLDSYLDDGGTFRPLCRPKRPLGEWCYADYQCESLTCSAANECIEDDAA